MIDEKKRKKLLHSWALHWWDFTNQPIDEIYSYFGTKVKLVFSKTVTVIICLTFELKILLLLQIAVYFAFLGMYTRWLLFPAAFGLILQIIDFGWVYDITNSYSLCMRCNILIKKGCAFLIIGRCSYWCSPSSS